MRGVRHFTDLQRHFYHPPKRRFAEHPTGQPHCATKLNTRGLIFKKLEPQGQKQEKTSLDEKRYLLHIKFKDNSKICPCINCKWPTVCLKSFPSLKRLQTRLLIPEFVVDNRTEELFRNLMALEQCHYPGDAYICDYIKLLDFLILNVYYVMGFRPSYFTCIAHLYLYYILLIPHTYASYIGHWCIFSHHEIQYKSSSISNIVSEPLLWPFPSSLVFISVIHFSTSLPPSQ